MDCFNQQSFQTEGSESFASSSSFTTNEENIELSIQKLSDNVSVSHEKSSSQDGESFTSTDLDTMVQDYKQLGGELELSLKLLENKRMSLNKILVETLYECEILNQHKECQKKNLVDLQIRSENLDTEKIDIWKENQKDKLEKMEMVKQEVQSVFENDEYICNTSSKFNEILKSEKNNFENFFVLCKRETELHKKEGDNYINEVRNVSNSFKCYYDEHQIQDSNAIKELNTALLNYKSLMESQSALKTNIAAVANALELSKCGCKTTEAVISQKKECIKKLRTNYQNFKDGLENVLVTAETSFLDLQSRYRRNSKELLKKEILLKTRIEDQESIKVKNFKLNEDLLTMNKNLHSRNEKLNLIFEECNSLQSNLKTVTNELENLEGEVKFLSEYKERLEQLEGEENELLTSVMTIVKEEELLTEKIELQQKFYENIKLSVAINQLEISKLSLENSKEWENNLNSLVQENRINFENAIKIKAEELNQLMQLIAKNEIKIKKLEDEIKTTESSIDKIMNLIKIIEPKLADIEGEEVNLKHKEDKCITFTNELADIEKELLHLLDELKNEEREIDEQHDLEILHSNLNRAMQLTKEAALYYEDQMKTIRTSYQVQEKMFKDKATREIGDIEKKSKKELIHEQRISLAIPQLKTEMIKLEDYLKSLLPILSKEIVIGLNFLNELVLFYKQTFDSKKHKVKATTIRNLSSIEEQLSTPMKCLMTLEYIPRISLNPPTSTGYQKVLNAFKEKYDEVVAGMDCAPPLEMANKLQEMGSCLFGKKYVRPTINPRVLNDSEISSSTEIYY